MSHLTPYERSMGNQILGYLAVCVVFVVIATFGGCRVARAAEIPDSLAIRAILGEARGEGYQGMYAVACAIRNRGNLEGVYGLEAKMEPISGALYQSAAKTWFESEDGPDVTNGAKNWDGAGFPKPFWAGKVLAVIGDQVFYAVIS